MVGKKKNVNPNISKQVFYKAIVSFKDFFVDCEIVNGFNMMRNLIIKL